MYRPSAVTLARFLIDLPLIAFQHVLFMLPFYFLSGLQVHAGKFFFFYLTLFISTVCFSNLLRMFAYYVPSLDDCKFDGLQGPSCFPTHGVLQVSATVAPHALFCAFSLVS